MRRKRFRLIPGKMEGLLIQKSSDFKGLSILIFDGVMLLRDSMLENWGSIRTDSSFKTIFCFVLLSFCYIDYSDLFSMELHLGLHKKIQCKIPKAEGQWWVFSMEALLFWNNLPHKAKVAPWPCRNL